MLFNALLAVLCVLLSCQGSTGQWNEDLPKDCESGMEHTVKCIRAAEAAVNATGCNWYRLIGPLSDCISLAVALCNVDEQDVWMEYVTNYNKTLNADGCYPACTDQETKAQRMFQCFNVANFEQLIVDIYSSQDTETSSGCRVLRSMTNCLDSSTAGCPALMDITHDRINNTLRSTEVFSMCGISPFQAATTNAPVALLDSNSIMPDPLSTTTLSGALDEGEKLLVILGSIVIISTFIVLIIVIVLTIRRRRAAYKRSFLRDWRPNGQRIFLDEPQLMPAQSSKGLYRPVAISHNNGYIDDVRHLQ